ncbi:MAG: HAD family phosphatase [Spirochaetaceae bacterium]|nr:HAD family phosphatase [Spirochaetaceae bacterium]
MKIDFRGAIFDLDGTITDSMGAWEYACGELCKTEKIIPYTDLKTDLKSLNLPEIAEYFVKNYNLLDSVENIYKKLLHFLLQGYEKATLKEGFADFITQLYTLNIPCYIASASERKCVELVLKKFGLTHYFSKIIVSSEEKISKDNPLFFEKIAQQEGFSKENTLVFEDSLFALQRAKEAGFKTIGIYDVFSEKHQDSISSIADFYGNSWKDITDFLFGGR